MTELRISVNEEYKKYLQHLAIDNNTSVSKMLLKVIQKKFPLKSTETEISETVNKADMEKRLVEVNTILNKARNGERLAPDEYKSLIDEQAKLRKILNHN